MEVPGLGVESVLQLLAYTTATAILDLSCICGLHWSLRLWQILNPLSEAGDQTHILGDISWILNLLSHNRNTSFFFYFWGGSIFFTSQDTDSVTQFSVTSGLFYRILKSGSCSAPCYRKIKC